MQQAVIAAKSLEWVLEFACVWITAEKYKLLFAFSPSSGEFGRDGLVFFKSRTMCKLIYELGMNSLSLLRESK